MPEEKNPGQTGENQEGDQPAAGEEQQPEKKTEETSAKEEKDVAKGGDEESVTISKKKYERLVATHNSKNAAKRARSKTRDSERFTFEEPQEEQKPSEEELDYIQHREFARVKQGIMDIVLDNPEIEGLVKNDKVLKRVLKNNPLSLLDDMPRDADDALEQLEDVLLQMAEPKVEPEKEEKKEEPKPAPQQPKETPEGEEKKTTYHDTMHGVERGLLDRMGGAGLS